ncbi:hypothetical protein KIPB_000395 [Kipferlia bialata]|uniref:SET domain-containing protein n=1 Tax=Kipferlia bialata TaxID=797122 RepID=A0A9K3CNB6_9EUKA|nr:hypothetical protein KIPB_000395 [Kipferlia bialata]|eukprot:g395.t1
MGTVDEDISSGTLAEAPETVLSGILGLGLDGGSKHGLDPIATSLGSPLLGDLEGRPVPASPYSYCPLLELALLSVQDAYSQEMESLYAAQGGDSNTTQDEVDRVLEMRRVEADMLRSGTPCVPVRVLLTSPSTPKRHMLRVVLSGTPDTVSVGDVRIELARLLDMPMAGLQRPIVTYMDAYAERERIGREIDSLPPALRSQFEHLSHGPHTDLNPTEAFMCRLNQNAFSCEDFTCTNADPSKSNLCLIAARFNHSCMPNVCLYWDRRTCMMVFHASRDIKKGEQLFVSYCHLEAPRAARQAKLDVYGFKCQCQLCAGLPKKAQANHDMIAMQFERCVSSTRQGPGTDASQVRPMLMMALKLALTYYNTSHHVVELRYRELIQHLYGMGDLPTLRQSIVQLIHWMEGLVPNHPNLVQYRAWLKSPKDCLDISGRQKEMFDLRWEAQDRARWAALAKK